MNDEIQQTLSAHFKSQDVRIIPLAGDASSRKYFRVVHDQQTWVLMVWEPFDPVNYPFLSVLDHFKKNQVKVPSVIRFWKELGIVLLEDLGDLTLERKFWENQNQELSIPFYEMAMDELVKIHFHATSDRAHPCTAFQIEFDTAKLLWEMNYGRSNLFEGVCQFAFSDSHSEKIEKAFFDICRRLHQEPKFIAHRDYHSRNLMLKFDEVRVIDFQDARLGPIQYDLVSLLRDSYVALSEDTSNHLLSYYLRKAKPFLPKSFSTEHFELIYELQSVQRCFKACGSFSSFYMQRKDTRYLKYISQTLRRVLKSLTFFPEYKIFTDTLIDSGALDKKYEALT